MDTLSREVTAKIDFVTFEKRSTLKGKNLLSRGAIFFLLYKILIKSKLSSFSGPLFGKDLACLYKKANTNYKRHKFTKVFSLVKQRKSTRYIQSAEVQQKMSWSEDRGAAS